MGRECRILCIRHQSVRDVADLWQRLILAHCEALWTVMLMSGVRDVSMTKRKDRLFRLKCRLMMVAWINWILFPTVYCSSNT